MILVLSVDRYDIKANAFLRERFLAQWSQSGCNGCEATGQAFKRANRVKTFVRPDLTPAVLHNFSFLLFTFLCGSSTSKVVARSIARDRTREMIFRFTLSCHAIALASAEALYERRIKRESKMAV